MTNADTDREKLLVLESRYEDLLKDLRRLEAENNKLKTDALVNAARIDQPSNKGLLTHLIETIKILATIVIILVSYKYGVQK